MTEEDYPGEMSLEVAEIDKRFVGRGLCSVDIHAAHRLNVQPSEILEVSGKKTTACICYIEDDDEGMQILRIDEWCRLNAGVKVGEIVKVRKAKPEPAKLVVVKMNMAAQIPPRKIRDSLMNRPVVTRDHIVLGSMNIPNRTLIELRLVVLETTPEDCIVQVTPMTNVEIKEGLWLDSDKYARDSLMHIGSDEGRIEIQLRKIMDADDKLTIYYVMLRDSKQINYVIDSWMNEIRHCMKAIEMELKFLENAHSSNYFNERKKPITALIKQDLEILKKLQDTVELKAIKEIAIESLKIHEKMNKLARVLGLVVE